jgi:hypothetical protein
MRRLPVVVTFAVLLLAGCQDEGAESRGASPQSSPQSAGSIATPVVSPLDKAQRALREANTVHYVFDVTSAAGVRVIHEEGGIQITPPELSNTRTLADGSVTSLVGIGPDVWHRASAGSCWEHPSRAAQDMSTPGYLQTVLTGSADDVRGEVQGGVFQLDQVVLVVASPLGSDFLQQLDLQPHSPARVPIRVSLDPSGGFASWETSVSDLVAAMDSAGRHPAEGLRALDATLNTTFSDVGSPVDVSPPPDSEVCTDDSPAARLGGRT